MCGTIDDLCGGTLACGSCKGNRICDDVHACVKP